MKNIKATLLAQIEALQIEVDNYTCTVQQAESHAKKGQEILNRMLAGVKVTDEEREYMTDGDNSASLITDMETLAAFKATYLMDLVHITTDYAITNKKLESPAGFHPESRVFIQPDICIHTNDPDCKRPCYAGRLYLTNLKNL